MRLIDADIVLEAIKQWAKDQDCKAIAQGALKAAEIVQSAPTIHVKGETTVIQKAQNIYNIKHVETLNV